MCRRTFLKRLSIALGALCGAAMAVPAIGFVLAPLFRKARPTSGAASARWMISRSAKRSTVRIPRLVTPAPGRASPRGRRAWLRRVDDTDNFIAFAVNCSHLHCGFARCAGGANRQLVHVPLSWRRVLQRRPRRRRTSPEVADGATRYASKTARCRSKRRARFRFT